ncbi:MAG TPA: thioredoxin family protein [Dehalococcoidia bacterium]|nr:thioredoxin family protein [Dehalococcoidia bacterium]
MRDQNVLRQRFSKELKSRLRIDFFTRRQTAIFVPGRECLHCDDVQTMLEELAALTTRITLTVHEYEDGDKTAAALGVDNVPAIVLRGQANRPLRYFGMPSGAQWPGFIETLFETASGVVQLDPEALKSLRKLRSDVMLKVLITPACPYSAVMSRVAFKFGLQNVRVKVDVIEVAEFPHLIAQIGAPVVPVTVINDEFATPGVLEEADLAQALLLAAEGKEVAVASRPGTVTPLVAPQSQDAPRTSPGGLFIPR